MKNRLKRPRFFLLFIIFIFLYSCSYFEDEDDIRLPGKRENVFEIEESNIVKANQRIVLSEPELIELWPQQHQNIRNHLSHFQSRDSLKLSKKLELGEINFEKFNHIVEPVIRGNNIFYINNDFEVFSKNLGTGKINWKTRLTEEKKEQLSFLGGIALSDEKLIVTSGLGNIYSIFIKNGKIDWSKKLSGQFSRPPTIFKNKIFAVSDDNQLIVMDINLGDQIWSHVGSIEEVSIIGGSKPAIHNEKIVVSYSSGEVFALNINDGGVVWFDNVNSGNFFNRNIVNDIQSPLSIEEDKVYVPTFSDKFIVYNLKDGRKSWNLKFSSINPFIISGDTLYILDISGRLLCLEKKTGKLLWAVQLRILNDDQEVHWRGPLLTSNKLLLASSDGSVISLSPFTGKTISKLKYSERFVVGPFQVDKRIFLITKEGRLFIFE